MISELPEKERPINFILKTFLLVSTFCTISDNEGAETIRQNRIPKCCPLLPKKLFVKNKIRRDNAASIDSEDVK